MESIIKSIFRKKTIVADYTQKTKTKIKKWPLIGLKIEVKAASLLAGPKAQLLKLPLLKHLVKRKRRHLLLR